MVTIYNIKKSEMINHPNGEVFYLLELRGLSTDEKPTTIENGTIENGSVFIEIDTQDVYIYDGENEVWLPQSQSQSQASLSMSSIRSNELVNEDKDEDEIEDPTEER